jgi:hypothetical protein
MLHLSCNICDVECGASVMLTGHRVIKVFRHLPHTIQLPRESVETCHLDQVLFKNGRVNDMIAPTHFGHYFQDPVAASTAPKAANANTNTNNTKAKNGKKRAAGAKSLNAPYQKLTPIFDDGDDNTPMDVEMDIGPTCSSQSCEVNDAISVSSHAVIMNYERYPAS